MSLGVVAASYAPAAPAGPTLVGTRRSHVGGFNPVMSLPAGIAVGDRLVMTIGSDDGLSTPAGWTQLGYDNPGGWFRGIAFHKVATAADVTAGTVTVGTGGNGSKSALCTALRGASAVALVFHDCVPNPGDAAEAVAVPAGSGILVYGAHTRNWSTVAGIDRGTLRESVTNLYHSVMLKTEAAGAAVTVNFSGTGTIEGTYYSVVRVT